MTKRSSAGLALFAAIAALLALSALAASCSSGFVGSDYGTVTLAMRPALGAKALDDEWPWGGPPVFASMTFDVVDGTGVSVLEADQPVVSGNTVTLRVRAGNGLRVSFQGEPDWAATATAYGVGEATLPAAALGYGGTSEPFDLAAGGTASATISLALTKTAILIPSVQDDWRLALATGLNDPDPDEYLLSDLNFNNQSDFFLDSKGTLYISHFAAALDTYALSTFGDLDAAAIGTFSVFGSSDHVAYDPFQNRMYLYYDSDGANLAFVDLDEAVPAIAYVYEPDGYYFDVGGVAVDEAGLVYAHMVNNNGDDVIAKLSVGDRVETAAGSTLVAEKTYDSLGLNYFASDMAMIGGRLIILFEAASLTDSSASRGYAAALDPTTLTLSWKVGWAGDANDYPTDGSSQFYGPRKIIGFTPDEVFIWDEGGSYQPEQFDPYLDVDRVVALDLGTGAFIGAGLSTVGSGYASWDY